MKIKRLVISTASIWELASFYGDLLGLTVTRNASRLIVEAGETSMEFVEAEGNPYYHLAFNIPSNKIEEAEAWLRQRVDLIWLDDYNSTIADFSNWNAKSVYFLDPAGNILELIARHDLNNAVEVAFSPRSILSVSELGLVVPQNNFDRHVNQLIDDYDLSNFKKQPPLESFRALGDDEGLFIVVPEGRNWYPTKISSAIFPINVEFVNKGRAYTM